VALAIASKDTAAALRRGERPPRVERTLFRPPAFVRLNGSQKRRASCASARYHRHMRASTGHVLRIIESAYRVHVPDAEWLNDVADASRPLIDSGVGVCAFEFRHLAGGAPKIVQTRMMGIPEEAVRLYPLVFRSMAPDAQARPFAQGPCTTTSQMMGMRGRKFKDNTPIPVEHREGPFERDLVLQYRAIRLRAEPLPGYDFGGGDTIGFEHPDVLWPPRASHLEPRPGWQEVMAAQLRTYKLADHEVLVERLPMHARAVIDAMAPLLAAPPEGSTAEGLKDLAAVIMPVRRMHITCAVLCAAVDMLG
jgi:hypothetical protein